MRTVVLTTLATLLLLAVAAGAQTSPYIGTCTTLYGNSSTDVDCSKLTGGPSPWVPIGPAGRMLLFKNIWGKGKEAKTGALTGPKTASVGLAGPLCWSGDAPTLTLYPTDPTYSPTPGATPGVPWQVPRLVEWEAVKMGGACQLCCTVVTP
ncbi:MAG: hypothetical protein ABSA52_15605 [Candidatus Binatia bacterium]|jgi:hypothetical protein